MVDWQSGSLNDCSLAQYLSSGRADICDCKRRGHADKRSIMQSPPRSPPTPHPQPRDLQQTYLFAVTSTRATGSRELSTLHSQRVPSRQPCTDGEPSTKPCKEACTQASPHYCQRLQLGCEGVQGNSKAHCRYSSAPRHASNHTSSSSSSTSLLHWQPQRPITPHTATNAAGDSCARP